MESYSREKELREALDVAKKSGNKELEKDIKQKLKSKEKQDGNKN